jgi:hypothetical protein
MKRTLKIVSLFALALLTSHMPATASSWWPFASQSTTAKSIQKKDGIYKKQLEAFITYHKLPEDEQTKKIYDYISELRSLAQVLNKKASKDRSPESNEDEDIAQILRCSELVKLLEREASMHPCYRSICCKEIQKAALNIVYRYRLAEPGNHLTCCIIDALGKLALLGPVREIINSKNIA